MSPVVTAPTPARMCTAITAKNAGESEGIGIPATVIGAGLIRRRRTYHSFGDGRWMASAPTSPMPLAHASRWSEWAPSCTGRADGNSLLTRQLVGADRDDALAFAETVGEPRSPAWRRLQRRADYRFVRWLRPSSPCESHGYNNCARRGEGRHRNSHAAGRQCSTTRGN
jgi:hypothetical protein